MPTGPADPGVAFVRTTEQPVLEPPSTSTSIYGRARANLFSSVGNTLITMIMIALFAWTIPPFLRWAFIDAVWTGTDRTACLKEGAGACWAFVNAKLPQFIYGRYPLEERWRVDIALGLLVAGLVPLLIPSIPKKRETVLYLLLIWPVLAFVLLTGQFGLPAVDTSLWGGLLLTLVIAVVGIVVSFPLGLVPAFGRRSKMPLVRISSIVFIEFWRGVPLITLLFMSSVMLPLFLPHGLEVDKLLRVLIGVVLFTSAYMAEAIRGGLQAIPKGQFEAADAMALSRWQTMRLIVLPQALKLAIPGILNTWISLFKDTSLVLIIGLFDLLGIVQLNFSDPKWASPQTPVTGYAFVALVFWIFCFSMSQYSRHIERRLNTSRAR